MRRVPEAGYFGGTDELVGIGDERKCFRDLMRLQ